MSKTIISADMMFVESNLVHSVVLLYYALEGFANEDPLSWLWSDDRKVLKSGCFRFPSVDPEAFKSAGGFPISTWGGTGGVPLPRIEVLNNEEESVDESEESNEESEDDSEDSGDD